MMVKELLKPNLINKNIVSQNHIQVVAQPMERGFGPTIGFAFKNIMLQGISGTAITQIIIRVDQVLCNQATSALPTEESLEEVLLNIRLINFKLRSNLKIARAELQVNQSKKALHAADLKLDEGLSILNPEIKICSYQGTSILEIICIIENNIGSRMVDNNWQQDGFHVDAFFSPVIACDYKVESARVGRNTDLNKLSLDIKTNGLISAEEALSSAVSSLYAQIKDLIIYPASKPVAEEKQEGDLFLKRDVATLELSARSLNCLRNEGLNTIAELTAKSEDELMKTPNFGKKSLSEIKERLAYYGHKLRD